MKKYPNEIKLMILLVLSFSLGGLLVNIIHVHYGHRNHSFPFREVEVVGPSASTSYLKEEFGDEYEIIMAAAARNGCHGESLLILFAIRKAENGGPGVEFGILCQAGTDLDTQAGWAAATIMKNRGRWKEADEELFGYKGFIFFLGTRYCPDDTVNWVRNVTYWFEKFKENENG